MADAAPPRGSRRLVYPHEWETDVVLADGGIVHLRPARAEDGEGLLGLYSRLSPESLYLRFFSPVPAPVALELERLGDIDYERRFALVAELGDDIVAIARYDRVGAGMAEIAFSVQDDQQGRGLGTTLLERLAAIARTKGIDRFTARTLPGNRKMLQVFGDAGFTVHKTFDEGTIEVTFEIEPTTASIEAQREHEHVSEARSVARILAPSSVAVIGAIGEPESIGAATVRNLLDGGFTGSVYPVNDDAPAPTDRYAYASVLDVPDHVDLAVLAVPSARLAGIVDDCAHKGVHGLVVLSPGIAEGGDQHGIARATAAEARGWGMRIVGPNSTGIVNTNPAIRMRATFAPPPPHGRIALASQSSSLDAELLTGFRALGLGVSSFASLGDKTDVSGNDLLQYWEEDPTTDVILLALASIGNRSKFAHLAHRITRHKPIVAVRVADEPDDLLTGAGVIQVDTIDGLLDTARDLAGTP